MPAIPEETEVGKLIGQFNLEIELADQGRQPKEWKWIKIEKYLAGKDVQDAEPGYEESKFFYRRLPRLTQIGKEKLFKHVCPLHGRPWEVRSSPRHNQNVKQDVQNKNVSWLRENIEDVHESMELETFLDDTCEFLSNLGTGVVYGPISLSNPHLRWQNGEEEIEAQDKRKPMWQVYDPKRVYPDPNGKKVEDLEYVHFHHVLSRHQIRSLMDDKSFIKEQLGDLLATMKVGNWAGNLKKWEVIPFPTNITGSALDRYLVWKRVGFLSEEALKALGEKNLGKELEGFEALDKDQRLALTESLWEIWFCDKFILKVAKRKFQPNKLPVYFIPFRRDPTSIFGIGIGEAALEVVEMLINITRSIDDALADTSGFQAMIDAGAIENKDLTVRGRKTWIYRNKGTSRKEGPSGRPIEFFAVPSNMEHLLACFKTFEAMLPVVTGIMEMTTGADLGSGVRTDQMMNDIWASLEEFLRSTVGNVDRYWWKPHLHDAYAWIKAYDPEWPAHQIEADLVVSGVRGALRRELVGRKLKDLYATLHQFGMPDWFDEIELIRAIVEGIGLESEKAVLTADQYVEKQALKAKQTELMAKAGAAPQNAENDKERAHTSARDAIIESFKSLMTANPNDPATIPLLERIFKLTGQLDEKAQIALTIRARMLAQAYEAQGVASKEEETRLAADVKPDSPLDVPKKPFDKEAAKQDTEMVAVNPQEKAQLVANGGAGAINPETGVRHFYQAEGSGGDGDDKSKTKDKGTEEKGEGNEEGPQGPSAPSGPSPAKTEGTPEGIAPNMAQESRIQRQQALSTGAEAIQKEATTAATEAAKPILSNQPSVRGIVTGALDPSKPIVGRIKDILQAGIASEKAESGVYGKYHAEKVADPTQTRSPEGGQSPSGTPLPPMPPGWGIGEDEETRRRTWEAHYRRTQSFGGSDT
jgi:hypothetical protein